MSASLEDLADSIGGSSGGLVDIDVSITDSDTPPPLSESDVDDMRRVDFP